MSRRDAQELLTVLFGSSAKLSLGTIIEMEKKTCESLKIPYEKVWSYTQEANVANVDETGWTIRGKKAWLWDASTDKSSLFRIDRNRNREACKHLLEKFSGVATTDRYGVYSYIDDLWRQLCWAHLKRDFQAIVDRGGPSAQIGKDGLIQIENLFRVWSKYKEGEYSWKTMQEKMKPVQKEVKKLLNNGKIIGDKKTSGFCKQLLKHWTALWTFTRVKGVEPTNNGAERDLRKAVIWRNISFGCSSEEGCRFVERMLTVVQTLMKQGRDVLEYIEQSIKSKLTGAFPPSIISDPAG